MGPEHPPSQATAGIRPTTNTHLPANDLAPTTATTKPGNCTGPNSFPDPVPGKYMGPDPPSPVPAWGPTPNTHPYQLGARPEHPRHGQQKPDHRRVRAGVDPTHLLALGPRENWNRSTTHTSAATRLAQCNATPVWAARRPPHPSAKGHALQPPRSHHPPPGSG
jgi:hypothetical protein